MVAGHTSVKSYLYGVEVCVVIGCIIEKMLGGVRLL